jgi:microcystin-dependent protein
MFLLSIVRRSPPVGGFFVSGDIKVNASTSIPADWLPCDGAAVSRTTYADLFATIGVTWGPGDGATTFNVPDFRDRFLVGAGTTYAVGDTGGADSVTLTVGQLPAHSHGVTDPGHTHTAAEEAATVTAGAAAGGAAAGNTGSATTGITIDDTGDGDPVSILPPYAAVQYLIKT